MDGWVKLYRRFPDWQWFKKPEMVQIFVFCLLSAAHRDHVWQTVNIRRGEFPTSVAALCRATGLSTQQVRTCLSRLERTGEITQKSTNKFTIISICNFDDYQLDAETEQQTTNNQTTNNQQSNNNTWRMERKGEREKGENLGIKEQEQQVISISHNSHVNGFSLSDLSEEERKSERLAFYRIFFFANALNPGRQTKQFIAANERNRWTDKGGVVWYTPEQRKAAAEGYCLDKEFATCGNNELWLVVRIYNALKDAGIAEADNWILNDGVGCRCTTANASSNDGTHILVFHCCRACSDFLSSVAGDKVVRALNLSENVKLYYDNNKFPRRK